MGSRENDAVRQLPKSVDALKARVAALEELIREDHKYMKELLRSIKKATVRKYKDGNPETETEPVDPSDVDVSKTAMEIKNGLTS